MLYQLSYLATQKPQYNMAYKAKGRRGHGENPCLLRALCGRCVVGGKLDDRGLELA